MNNITIPQLQQPFDATVKIPGCKSITNRVLVIAALVDGETILEEALFSEDTELCVNCLQALGIPVEADSATKQITIQGQGGKIPADHADLFVGLSGTTARFVTALVALGEGRYQFDGIPRMRERPMGDMLTILEQLGTTVEYGGQRGFMPYSMQANRFPGGHIKIDASKTSQQLSGLLMITPYAQQDTMIEITDKLVSIPYIDITLQMMRDFGVEVMHENYKRFHIKAGQRYKPQRYLIEPDASNATYFFAAAALTGSRLRVNHLTNNSCQGDAQFVQVLADMGCQVTVTDSYTEVVGPKQLHGLDIDLNGMSDTVPTLAAIAPFADSPITIRNVEHIRWKETDRISAVVSELQRLGATVEAFQDGLKIYPSTLQPAEIETYNDHRMAMAFAVTGLKQSGVVIKDPICTHKTYPTFFDDFKLLLPQ
ncbi:3-phosphoshikimate 1-carboxyvinyltransferase [Anaerolineales bacterium HSG25]|nr:3-phosphoshikimate 1-carboxyvinyltransferase [Anaerolineales bacterium HSG25]